jgi:radical SAM superfamily enzyme YgiQ (UPF0313 family)
MKILFISPRISKYQKNSTWLRAVNKIKDSVVFTSHLNFRILSALTPERHSIKLIDEEYQTVNFDEDFDVIGITTTTPSASRAYEIADEFRKRDKKVVIGGWHSSALPNEAKLHADSVFIGEAEETWPQLIDDFSKGEMKNFYYQEKPTDLRYLPIANKNKMAHKAGFIIEKIQSMRGCNMGCGYCAITNSKYGKKVRFRPVEEVINEIESIPQKIFYFCDPSFTMNPNYSKELFKGIKNLNKKFYCNGNIGILYRDDELLKLASEAGCIEWAIGLESVSQESLDIIGKKTNKVKEFKPGVKKIHDYGMGVMGNFMFGLDGDHKDIFNKTVNAVYDLELDQTMFNIFTPLPGTPLFNQMEREQRILTRDWEKYDLSQVVFKPKHMTPQELLRGTKEALEQIFSLKNTIQRSYVCLKRNYYSFFMTGLESLFRKLII